VNHKIVTALVDQWGPRLALDISRLPRVGEQSYNSPERQRLAAIERRMTTPATPAGVKILQLVGVLVPKAESLFFTTTSMDSFALEFRDALRDPKIGTIVISVDSPGGTVAGTSELATTILAARGQKQVVAHVGYLCASAAFWIASAAERLIVSPSGEVGSVGVFLAHFDYSEQLRKDGVRPTLIHAGRFKTEGNPYEPLTAAARQQYQKGVDESHQKFIAALARHRGVSAEIVATTFGEGRIFGASEAVARRMADEVATYDSVLSRYGLSRRAPTTGQRAESSDPGIQSRRLRLRLLEREGV